MEKAVIDRIVDGKHAILLVGENEKEVVVPLEALPDGAKEGAWVKVVLKDGTAKKIEIDSAETAFKEINIEGKIQRLRKRSKSNFKT